ncbi:MAG: thiamine phosphate synthase [Mariprofundales bacterium]|nr:thiamine phosphate synthase [Mariprofundales bacterium]
MTASRIAGIYAILPADLPLKSLLAKAESALDGGIHTLQLRDKKQGFRRGLKRATSLRQLCRLYDATLIINDSIPLATESGADGVHLGREDMPTWQEITNAREAGLIVGITCRADAALAKSALTNGASYLSFGAIFPSTSKAEVPAIGLPRLAKARSFFPDANLIAIGGIDASNVIAVQAAGADAAAIISGLFAANDITKQARQLMQLWNGDQECNYSDHSRFSR